MKMIELHIIQSFPVTCLNRDDLGSPKSATFGGVERARVSSQCWKRAIRIQAKEKQEGMFDGKRGHFWAEKLEKAIIECGIDPMKAKDASEAMATFLGKKNSKYKEGHKTEVALYFSPGEINLIAGEVANILKEGKKIDPDKGSLKKVINKTMPKDLADIAIFGRMVADDHTLMLEGAANFSHAISTHKVSNEIDFFSAVDDLKPEDSEGAGHIGTLEFNSACYYRYVGINLDLLRDKDHLAHFSKEELEKVLNAFIRSCLEANPVARKNSMFGYTRPDYVLGLCRKGQPLSLANAFEKPVRPNENGYVEKSAKALKEHFKKMKATWGIETNVEKEISTVAIDKTNAEKEIPIVGIDEFVTSLLGGVGNE